MKKSVSRSNIQHRVLHSPSHSGFKLWNSKSKNILLSFPNRWRLQRICESELKLRSQIPNTPWRIRQNSNTPSPTQNEMQVGDKFNKVKVYRSSVQAQRLLGAPRGNHSSSIPSSWIFFDLPLMWRDSCVSGACMKRILRVNVWIQEDWRFNLLVWMKSESEERIRTLRAFGRVWNEIWIMNPLPKLQWRYAYIEPQACQKFRWNSHEM